nr:EutP/PduV family microcompartment system protein [Fictibacillus macauensis]
MIIGAIGAGKTTLTNALLGMTHVAVKTQAMNYKDWIIDTPGEYSENPMFYKTIMATSLEASHVIFLQDATRTTCIFPPGFSKGIPKRTLGVITKIDHDQADVKRSITLLRRAMSAGPIVLTSAPNAIGIHHIYPILACETDEEIQRYCHENSENIVL